MVASSSSSETKVTEAPRIEKSNGTVLVFDSGGRLDTAKTRIDFFAPNWEEQFNRIMAHLKQVPHMPDSAFIEKSSEAHGMSTATMDKDYCILSNACLMLPQGHLVLHESHRRELQRQVHESTKLSTFYCFPSSPLTRRQQPSKPVDAGEVPERVALPASPPAAIQQHLPHPGGLFLPPLPRRPSRAVPQRASSSPLPIRSRRSSWPRNPISTPWLGPPSSSRSTSSSSRAFPSRRSRLPRERSVTPPWWSRRPGRSMAPGVSSASRWLQICCALWRIGDWAEFPRGTRRCWREG